MRRGREKKSLRAGITSVSVIAPGSASSGAGDEATVTVSLLPEIADCLRFRDGGYCVIWVGNRRVLGPGEFENSRGGEESALANMILGRIYEYLIKHILWNSRKPNRDPTSA